MNTTTWANVIHLWRNEMLAADDSAGTIDLRIYHVGRWERAFAKPDPLTAERADLVRFLAHPGWAPEYRRSIRSSLKGVYTFAFDEGFIPENPAARLPKVRCPIPPPRPATDQAIEDALRDAGDRLWLMIILGAVGGLRRAEIARVNRDDLDVQDLRVHGKGRKVRVVHLPAMIAARIEAITDPHGWAFPNTHLSHAAHHGRPLTAKHVGKLISGALPEGVTPHQLRHAAASYLHNRCRLSIAEISLFLGHASIATTQRYVFVETEATNAAIDQSAVRFTGPRYVTPAARPIRASAA